MRRRRDKIAELVMDFACRWPLASAWALLLAFWALSLCLQGGG